MKVIEVESKAVTINIFGDVVCPYPDPQDRRHLVARYFEEDEAQIVCDRGHSHSIKDFPGDKE